MSYSKLTKINKYAGFGKRKVKPPEIVLQPKADDATDLPEDIRALIPRMGERQARIVWQWRKKGLRASAPEALVYDWLTKKKVPFEFQCLAGHHKVLTADWLWKPIAELQPGEELIALEEDGPNRRLCRSSVIACEPAMLEARRVVLSNGDEFIATPEHPWLAYWSWDPRSPGYPNGSGSKTNSLSWVQTDRMLLGTRVPKGFAPWEPDTSWDAGYLAGFFDGEGSFVQSGTANSLTAGQNPGATLENFIRAVERTGFNFSVYDYNGKYKRSYDDGFRKCVNLRISGGKTEALRFIGTIRPPRLLAGIKVDQLGRMPSIERPHVVAIEDAGRQEIYRLATTSATYIADGYAMHNSSFFGGRIYRGGLVNDFALYHLPQGVMIWRIQGEYYHAPTREKDEANKQRLLMSRVKNRKVVAVVDLWERDLYRGVDGVCRDALTGRGRRG